MWKMSIRVIITHVPTVLCALYYCFLFSDWSDEAVTNAEILRLIYQGRFLHCNVTLSALGLATGKTTVMHLVPRENLPEPNSQGMHCVLSSLYVVLHSKYPDSRVPWFPTLNNSKYEKVRYKTVSLKIKRKQSCILSPGKTCQNQIHKECIVFYLVFTCF